SIAEAVAHLHARERALFAVDGLAHEELARLPRDLLEDRRDVADGAVALDEEDGLVDVTDEGLKERRLAKRGALRSLEDEVDVADLGGREGEKLHDSACDRRGDVAHLLFPDVHHRLRNDRHLLDRLAELHALGEAGGRQPPVVFAVDGGRVLPVEIEQARRGLELLLVTLADAPPNAPAGDPQPSEENAGGQPGDLPRVLPQEEGESLIVGPGRALTGEHFRPTSRSEE